MKEWINHLIQAAESIGLTLLTIIIKDLIKWLKIPIKERKEIKKWNKKKKISKKLKKLEKKINENT